MKLKLIKHKTINSLFGFLLLCIFPACATNLNKVADEQQWNFAKMTELLATEGLDGEIHSAQPDMGLFVFTYRDANDFFNYIHMSLITRSPSVREKLASLNRHDRIKIWGAFAEIHSPQKHIRVDNLDLLKKFESNPNIPKYNYDAKIPRDLSNKTHEKFLVHAVHEGGKILVLEYKDAVIPAFVENPEVSSTLWRNDKIEMDFVIQEKPRRPTHLIPDVKIQNPIRRYHSVQDLHWEDKKKRLEAETNSIIEDNDPRLENTLTGELVLFPKSPQVRFDVWALLQKDEKDGIRLTYTIVNFEDNELFTAIRNKLNEAWKLFPTDYVSGRNKLVHTKVKVRVTGKLNVVDSNQANTPNYAYFIRQGRNSS